MSDFYIMPEWLEAVRGTTLFYPAAGSDYNEALTVFQDYVDTFWFSDITYPAGLDLPPVFSPGSRFALVKSEKSGATEAIMEERSNPDPPPETYRFLEPSKLTEIYKRNDGRQLTVVRRRGFGQIALSTEFTQGSLSVFMHRGDSPGEAGSNVYFLANKTTSYEPCGNLFDKIGSSLTDCALIVSDGSNTSMRWLRRFHGMNDIEGHKAFACHLGRDFNFGDFRWTCVGWLSQRHGPTLVWGVTRQANHSKP